MSRKRTDHRRCFCKKLMSNCACRSTNLVEFPSKSEYLDFSYFSLCFLLHRSFSPTRHVFSDFLFQEEEKKSFHAPMRANREPTKRWSWCMCALSKVILSFVVRRCRRFFFIDFAINLFLLRHGGSLYEKFSDAFRVTYTVALEFKSRRMKISY